MPYSAPALAGKIRSKSAGVVRTVFCAVRRMFSP
jgi:hypothetical protein